MTRFFGKAIGLIFGLAFAGFGIFFLSMTSIPLLQAWVSVKDWQPVSAELLNVATDNNETRAKYRYTYHKKNYQSNRVYLADIRDNIGSYHQKLQARLKHHLKTRQPLQIWLDPDKPQYAVIDKEMRWGLFAFMTIFCSVFIFIGLLISWAALFSQPIQRRNALSLAQLRKNWQLYRQTSTSQQSFLEFVSQQRKKIHLENQQNQNRVVDKEWLNKKEWQKDGIRSEAKSSTIGMWIFAILWNGISSPLFFVFAKEWESGNYAILLALLFPLVGLYLLFKAINITREYIRFGTILCKLDPFPGAIGGHVGGTLEIERVRDSRAEFRLELECIYSYMSGSGKNRSRRENVLWAEAGNAKINNLAHGIRLQFSFDVPENLPQSEWQQRGNYHFWQLRLRSTQPGVDLERTYKIPVYSTGEHSNKHYPSLSRQMIEKQEEQADCVKMALERGDFEKAGLSKTVKIHKIDRGIRLVHSIFRNKVLSLVALFFGGAFSAATYGILSSVNSSSLYTIISLIFSLPFALVGLIGICAAIYLPLNNLRVTIAKGRISVLRRLLFIPLLFKDFAAAEISDCTVKKSGSSGQGVNKKEYYKIVAHTVDGKNVTISEGICGLGVAQQFKEYIHRRIKAGY